MLEVRVLGGLSAMVDGGPVELPADARARELLARLALAPGPHPRSALAGRLRPDVPEDSARKSLRSALYELRRALGPAADRALVATTDRVGLAHDVRVDVQEFRRRLAAGDLQAAADAGAGVLLDGFDGEWARQARDEHAAAYAGLLATLTEQAEAADDLDTAVAWARRRLAAEPLAEAAHRELIRLLARGGDRPAALAAARTASDRLRTELGVPLSAETRALIEDVRRGRVARAAVVERPPVPPVLAAAARPEGREPALARLERTWAGAQQGALRFALVTGEAGIGKTTLAGELARRVHAQGGAVALGRSDELALVPYQPWVEALEGLLAALPAADVDHWVTAHDGALGRLLPARGPAAADAAGPRERYLAFELVRELLAAVAARWPLLLVLDDVHWMDPDSLTLLRHLARSGSPAPVLAVLCARETELEPALPTLAELSREGPLERVALAGLDDEAVAVLLSRRTGVADAGAARRLRVRSGGNPFFLVELLRQAGDAEGPPAGVREAIARRLAGLDEPARRTLETAALCGHEFDLATVAEVENRPVVEVLEALDGAVDAAIIAETAARGRYAFVHALVDEAIVWGLPASRRARLHLRIADVLAGRHGAGEVVHHLREAGTLVAPERLARWELDAAREASARLAHDEAAAHYEAALAAAPGADDRGDVLLALGDAHDRAGRREAARAAFARAAEAARDRGDAELLARAALGHGGRAVVIAAADPATVALLEEALAAGPGAAATARLLARLSIELYYSDRRGARELSGAAVEHARAGGDPAALAAALNSRRVALWAPEHVDERLATAEAMIAAAQRAGDREAVLQGRNWRVVDLIELGRMREAVAEIDAYEELAGAIGLPHFRWYVPLWRATLAMLDARWEDARDLTRQAQAIGARADDPNAELFAGIQHAHRLWTQQRAAELDRQRLVAEAAASSAPADWLVNLALAHAISGATDEARRLVRELSRDGVRALAMDANWHSACVLGEAAVLVGDRDAGADLYALLEPHADLFAIVARAVGCLGSTEAWIGRLAGLLGRDDEAVARLRRAVERNDRAGARSWAATALLHLGEALARAGDEGAARDALGEAAARAAQLDMPAVVAEAQRRLDSTCGRPLQGRQRRR